MPRNREDDNFNFDIWDSTKCHVRIVLWYSGERRSLASAIDVQPEWRLPARVTLPTRKWPLRERRMIRFQINVRLCQGALNGNGRSVHIFITNSLTVFTWKSYLCKKTKKWLFVESRNLFCLFYISIIYANTCCNDIKSLHSMKQFHEDS